MDLGSALALLLLERGNERIRLMMEAAQRSFGIRGVKVGRQAQIMEAQGSMMVQMSRFVITSVVVILG